MPHIKFHTVFEAFYDLNYAYILGFLSYAKLQKLIYIYPKIWCQLYLKYLKLSV